MIPSVITNAIRELNNAIPRVLTGTVVSDLADLGLTQVVVDNDPSGAEVTARSLFNRYPVNTRVTLLSYPPRGLVILGADDSNYANIGWQTWEPRLAQGVTTNITKTFSYGRYVVDGDTVIAQVYMNITGAGTANSRIEVTLPVPAAGVGVPGGFFFLRDASAATLYTGIALVFTGALTANFVIGGTSTSDLGNVGSGFTAALANGDDFRVALTYQKA